MKALFNLFCIACIIIGIPIIMLAFVKEFVVECWELGEKIYRNLVHRISEYGA